LLLAHCFFHERGNFSFFGGGQFIQREGDWPHDAFVAAIAVSTAASSSFFFFMFFSLACMLSIITKQACAWLSISA
jgi:hypothetical protein